MEQTKKPLPGAVLLLAALGFVLGTCEFVIVGILPEIAEGLNTSLAAVGKLVSVFAACYAVGDACDHWQLPAESPAGSCWRC